MPTYQYACTACEERLEVVQKFTDDSLTECATCGGRLRKVFSPVGIVFKGSGFYRTDSRNGAAANGTKDKQPNAAPGGSSSASDKPAGGDSAKPPGESGTAKKSGTRGASGGSAATATKVA